MNGDDIDDDDVLDEEVSDDTLTGTVVLTEVDEDPMGDTTIEMDIERLVAKLEDSDREDVHRRAEIRRRLEELREQRDLELDSTFNFNLDDEV